MVFLAFLKLVYFCKTVIETFLTLNKELKTKVTDQNQSPSYDMTGPETLFSNYTNKSAHSYVTVILIWLLNLI